MKRIAYIVVILCMFLSCGIRREYKDALLRAETVMDEHPDSAMQILDSLGQHESEFTRHFRMQYQLHRQNAVNKTSDKFTSDSLCQVLVSYFDRHGSVNERVLAHYLLGRAYTDMGDAPQAISSYQDAISAADTTVTGFNYRILSNVYAQMAGLYRHQFLMTNEIEARKKASYYAFRADQPKWGIYNHAISAGAYILLNKKDSAELILKSAIEEYRKYGYSQEALRYSRALIHIYTDSPQRLLEAKALMDFYRKIFHQGMPFVVQDLMYGGLLSVFTKRHQADSIAKYARLYCMANDSSIALKDRDIVAQMTATYNYSRLQKEAHENEVKAYKTLLGLIISAVVAVLALVAAFLVWKRFRRKYQQEIMQLKTEYANASYEYEENLRELLLLESAHQENESERKRLLDENVELQSRIRELQKEKAISRNLSASALFAEEPIVKRFHEIGVQPLENVKEEEWAELTDTFANSYPDLFLDLCQYCNTPQSIRVCMLTVMGLGNNEQANLLGTTSSRISNVKLALNKALFNESSSRTLNKNLLVQYSVY